MKKNNVSQSWTETRLRWILLYSYSLWLSETENKISFPLNARRSTARSIYFKNILSLHTTFMRNYNDQYLSSFLATWHAFTPVFNNPPYGVGNHMAHENQWVFTVRWPLWFCLVHVNLRTVNIIHAVFIITLFLTWSPSASKQNNLVKKWRDVNFKGSVHTEI